MSASWRTSSQQPLRISPRNPNRQRDSHLHPKDETERQPGYTNCRPADVMRTPPTHPFQYRISAGLSNNLYEHFQHSYSAI